MSYDLGDYIEVADRVRDWYQLHPEGALRCVDSHFVRNAAGEIVGYFYRAAAYRNATDDHPAGEGEAFEPIPGKTSFTRDSEVQNCETSAWGRAIVAAGLPSKKIASANEVRNRQEPAPSARANAAPTGETSSASTGVPSNGGSTFAQPAVERGGNPGGFPIAFGKHKGKTLAEIAVDDHGYIEWLAANANKADVKQAAEAVLDPDASIPF